MPRDDEIEAKDKVKSEEARKYVEGLDKRRTHHQNFLREGYERTWEQLITPELAILYADGVEDYNPWYEAWPNGKGKSAFGGAVVPPLLLAYWSSWFLPEEDEGSASYAGLIHYSHNTEILAPCFIGTLVRFRLKVTKMFVKRDRDYLQMEATGEDANTGKLLMRDTSVALFQPKTVSQ
jgi:acyl dehydratase